MGFLGDVNTSEIAKQESDRRKGGHTQASGVYGATVKYAYTGKSQGGAHCVHLLFDLDNGGKHKETIYVTKKTGEPTFGFNLVNALSVLGVKKKLKGMPTSKKTINIWDWKTKKDAPTEVDMLDDLIGGRVSLALTRRIENGSKLNDATGDWDKTKKKITKNVINKFFQLDTNLSMTELKAGSTEAKAFEGWEKDWKGVDDDKYEEITSAGTEGTPQAGAAASTTDLFDD